MRPFRRLPALARLELLSANLAIGTASAFVLVTAAASLAVDREVPAPERPPASWHLRGSLTTSDPCACRGIQTIGSRMPAAVRVARL